MHPKLSPARVVAFHRAVTDYYYQNGRHDMLWRRPGKNGRFDPYKILVSELMLQQTQVERVTPKYAQFLEAFPTVQALAAAKLSDVLKAWSGLGYNRRAKYIWQAASVVVDEFDGVFPETARELQRLPGVGPNTAGAIMAYAYDQPVVFVETNVRTVIIHHFFKDKKDVPDSAIREVLAAVVPASPPQNKTRLQGAVLAPREFYWALMDYGSHLKKTVGNLNRASRSYTKQSAFHGSKRQLRGRIIRLLADGPLTMQKLRQHISDERLEDVVDTLEHEDMIIKTGRRLRLG